MAQHYLPTSARGPTLRSWTTKPLALTPRARAPPSLVIATRPVPPTTQRGSQTLDYQDIPIDPPLPSSSLTPLGTLLWPSYRPQSRVRHRNDLCFEGEQRVWTITANDNLLFVSLLLLLLLLLWIHCVVFSGCFCTVTWHHITVDHPTYLIRIAYLYLLFKWSTPFTLTVHVLHTTFDVNNYYC